MCDTFASVAGFAAQLPKCLQELLEGYLADLATYPDMAASLRERLPGLQRLRLEAEAVHLACSSWRTRIARASRYSAMTYEELAQLPPMGRLDALLDRLESNVTEILAPPKVGSPIKIAQ
jgi:hypothetical protein